MSGPKAQAVQITEAERQALGKLIRAGKTPLDLIPRDANSPNTRHIGIELLGNLTNRLYSDAQYKALARLVVLRMAVHATRVQEHFARFDEQRLRALRGLLDRALP